MSPARANKGIIRYREQMSTGSCLGPANAAFPLHLGRSGQNSKGAPMRSLGTIKTTPCFAVLVLLQRGLQPHLGTGEHGNLFGPVLIPRLRNLQRVLARGKLKRRGSVADKRIVDGHVGAVRCRTD